MLKCYTICLGMMNNGNGICQYFSAFHALSAISFCVDHKFTIQMDIA